LSSLQNEAPQTPHEDTDPDPKAVSKTLSIPFQREPRRHGRGCWGGERVVANFRCDKRLWDAFRLFCRDKYGSICKPLESIIVALMSPELCASDLGYTLSRDVTPILHIDKLVIQRSLSKERRNVPVVDEAPLVELAGPFVKYYLARPSLSPGSNQIYREIHKEHPDLSWDQRKSLATIILKDLKELRENPPIVHAP